MSSVVLDASALLALLNAEPGADAVEAAMTADGAVMSIVNWAEVLSKATETGVPPEAVRERLASAGVLGTVLRIEPMTEDQKTERPREVVRSRGLSGRLDSNQRPLDPQSSALTRLRYAPRHLPCFAA